jgi:hypothetical protein
VKFKNNNTFTQKYDLEGNVKKDDASETRQQFVDPIVTFNMDTELVKFSVLADVKNAKESNRYIEGDILRYSPLKKDLVFNRWYKYKNAKKDTEREYFTITFKNLPENYRIDFYHMNENQQEDLYKSILEEDMLQTSIDDMRTYQNQYAVLYDRDFKGFSFLKPSDPIMIDPELQILSLRTNLNELEIWLDYIQFLRSKNYNAMGLYTVFMKRSYSDDDKKIEIQAGFYDGYKIFLYDDTSLQEKRFIEYKGKIVLRPVRIVNIFEEFNIEYNTQDESKKNVIRGVFPTKRVIYLSRFATMLMQAWYAGGMGVSSYSLYSEFKRKTTLSVFEIAKSENLLLACLVAGVIGTLQLGKLAPFWKKDFEIKGESIDDFDLEKKKEKKKSSWFNWWFLGSK